MFTDVVARAVTILVVTNGNANIGDKNNSLKVSQEIQHYVKDNFDDKLAIKCEEHDHNYFDYRGLVTQADNDQVYIIITAGEYGIKVLNKLAAEKNNNIKMLRVWSGHMKFASKDANLEKIVLERKVDYVIIPKHALTKEEKRKFRENTDLFLHQTGVPFLLNLDIVKKATAERGNKDYLYENKAINLILGGDAPDLNGEKKIFPLEQAKEMVKYAKNNAEKYGYELHITTSGRTPEDIVKWLDKLKNQENIKYFNHKTDPNAYKAMLLHAHENSEDMLWITGDSTSVVAESEAFSDNLWIIPVDSMNEVHWRQAAIFEKKSYAKLLDMMKDLDITNVINHSKTKPAYDHETHDIVFKKRLGERITENVQKMFDHEISR